MRSTCLIVLSLFVAAAAGSVNVQRELQDFIDLLPKVRLGFIFGKHYLFDSSFRTGYKYLKSMNFQSKAMEELGNSPEVRAIVHFLGLEYPVQFDLRSRSIEVPFGSAEDYARERSFSSFIDDFSNILPANDIKSLIRKKMSSYYDVRRFYSGLMDPQLEPLVSRARDVALQLGIIEKLKANEIDVDYILKVAFKLLKKWKN